MGTELETDCSTLGARRRAARPTPSAEALFGYIGCTWNPVGFEFMLGGMVDSAKQTATFAATPTATTATLSPAADPPRAHETFSFLRVGGVAALRARVAFQRTSCAARCRGPRGLLSPHADGARRAAATSTGKALDKYVPDPVSYVSPAISPTERCSFASRRPSAIAVGVTFLADNASIAGNSAVAPSPGHNPLIPTPAKHRERAASYIGPFLGMQFGP